MSIPSSSQLTEVVNSRKLRSTGYRATRSTRLYLACFAQLFTTTPEEHVANAWRRLDPTTHVLTKQAPRITATRSDSISGERSDDERSIRVKFFLNAELSRLVHNRCIYSTFPLEPCGGLNLNRVSAKWGLYNCEIVFESKQAAFDIAYPSNTRLILSAEEIKLYRDFEGAIRIIESPPPTIRLYRQYRTILMEEYRFWRYSPDTQKRLQRFYFYLATAAESATAPLFPMSRAAGRAYKTAVHLGPLLLAYWIWNRFDGWMLASTACLHLLRVPQPQ